ncbi:dihydroorotase [Propionibacterium cyclohexanicum]|uniref:Dihydroorotase n=2 Tax=Propionibacterium cyclohexanicum TaxID=64702 RepID=A0A1H9SS97_9ACTN|nr:dihydroorotase [Propionibacterium cyclohexanicum]
MDWLLRGVDVLGQGERELYLHRGRLDDPAEAPQGTPVVDCTGLVALPALVDPHTHLRDPGSGRSETIASGLRAAAAGGYGAVFAMPNTTPVADSAGIVEYEVDTAAALGGADLYAIGAVTKGQQGEELAEIAAMAASRAHVAMFSDDGHCVARSDVMRDALIAIRDAGAVLAQHAQDPLLTVGAQLDDGELAARLGKTGWPKMAESVIIARDAIMAAELGARLHVCHVSTASGVEVVRWAKSMGYPVTAEASPHHLALTVEDAAGLDPAFKVNPPLRSPADVAAVRSAFLDGTLDMVGTDHAPHPDDAKACGWDQAANGMLGLETALAVVADLFVRTGQMSWAQLAQRMSDRPAELLRLGDSYGADLTLGRPASLCLIAPDQPWQVDPRQLASIAHNTPYARRSYHARVVATVLRGVPIFDLNARFAMT